MPLAGLVGHCLLNVAGLIPVRPGADLFGVFVTARIHLLAVAVPPLIAAVSLVVRIMLLDGSTPIVVEAREGSVVTALPVLNLAGLLAVDEPGRPGAGIVLRRLDVNLTRLLAQLRQRDQGIAIAERRADDPVIIQPV